MESTKSCMLRAAFTGDNNELLNILNQLYQQQLSGDTIETEIMQYIQYSVNHSNPQIAIVASFFKQKIKYCDLSMESVSLYSNELLRNRFETTQTLYEVVQFIKSQKLVLDVAMLKVGAGGLTILPNKFDTLLAEFCQQSYNNNNNNTDAISLSLTVFDTGYMEWQRTKIFENLLLRYNLGIITTMKNNESYFESHTVYNENFRRKCEAIAQRTILENFELREMVNELRDDNFHLRNEIIELADKLSRQIVLINKLKIAMNLQNFKVPEMNTILCLSDTKILPMIDMKMEMCEEADQTLYKNVGHSHLYDDELTNHLIMRYDDGCTEKTTVQDENEGCKMVRKAMALTQRVITENYELRQMVDDLRYRNVLLRNCIYAQQDQINYFVLFINKLERYPEMKRTKLKLNDSWQLKKTPELSELIFKTKDGYGRYSANARVDWNKWNNISNKVVNAYIRQCVEKEYKIIIPEQINPLIANYAIYILCVVLM